MVAYHLALVAEEVFYYLIGLNMFHSGCPSFGSEACFCKLEGNALFITASK